MELAQTFPIHVVCSWLGNSPAVATKHYLQVTDADFEKAMAEGNANSGAGDALQPGQTTQIPTQPAAADFRQFSPETQKAPENRGFCPELAKGGEYLHACPVPPEGLEPSTL
jgi:hypothetical protein